MPPKFPTNGPRMPRDIRDEINQNGPDGLIRAMDRGLDGFSEAAQEGASLLQAGELFQVQMQDAYEVAARGDGSTTPMDLMSAYAQVAGPALMGLPAEPVAGEIAKTLRDAADWMMPKGEALPPEFEPMFVRMEEVVYRDFGYSPHELALEYGPRMPG